MWLTQMLTCYTTMFKLAVRLRLAISAAPVFARMLFSSVISPYHETPYHILITDQEHTWIVWLTM